MRIPNTLFFKTATTLITTLLLLSVIILASTAYFVLVPVGKRSADDLAALLMLSAQTWTELPPDTRPDFETELLTAHNIRLLKVEQPLDESGQLKFYIYQRLLEQALEKRLGDASKVTIGTDIQHPGWIWIDIPMPERKLRFGISAERIGARPPIVLLAAIIAILVLTVGAALILASRLTRPLAILSRATAAVGRGEEKLVPEDEGSDEVVTLARNFNQMSHEVSELLENRTTLLAGISHDLRTPLTHMRVALEINREVIEPSLREGLERDVDDMEQLLKQVLLVASGTTNKESLETRDLIVLLSTLAAQVDGEWHAQHQDSESRIEFKSDDRLGTVWKWPLPQQALLRILHNLLENSLRYGNDKPITIALSEHNGYPLISILDRGPGIPEEKRESVFRPFYRIEGSRNLKTGGSGLGLAIVRQLCQAQGWEVSLHSRIGGGNEARLLLGRST
jgi:two-component system osmolarity sensor histidine kinase EnvZ